jgi:protein TonB
MRHARVMAGAAVVVSVGLHAGGLIALAPPEPVSLGGTPQLAMIGNSFEDAAAGTLTAVTTPETINPVTPTATAQPVTAAALPKVQPVLPVAATRPDRAASAPVETVAAIEPPAVQTPDADTPRPRARPEPAPQGNAERSARRGDTGGQPQGRSTSTSRGNEGMSASDGRAVAEYPQQVNRHLSRLRRPATRFGGTAVIAFTVGGNGGLAALSVARSSGNADFDRLALAHVQRAAPFPPPPSGAQRSFNVTVQGR